MGLFERIKVCFQTDVRQADDATKIDEIGLQIAKGKHLLYI